MNPKSLDAATLGQLYQMRDAVRRRIDQKNGGVPERAWLLQLNRKIADVESERRKEAAPIVPPMRWKFKRDSVW